MYKEIGAFDAKAKLSQLLQGVKKGGRYTITVRGKPIADLIPSKSASHDVKSAIEEMRKIRKIRGVSAKKIAEWLSEGRK